MASDDRPKCLVYNRFSIRVNLSRLRLPGSRGRCY